MTVLTEVDDIKPLVFTNNHDLSWSQHIDSVRKMAKGIAMARKCLSYITPATMKDAFNPLVLSHLEYCYIFHCK